MDKDYNEIWLQAMDTLIVQRLQNLPFDQTIVCKIIDVSKKDQGIYTVSNESTEFEAYSENTHYSIDNQVYVNIPKGDWSQKKQITGRHSTDTDKDPIVYVAPLEKVSPLTENIVPEGKSSGQLVANWPLTSEGKAGPYTQLLFTITDKSINTAINDTLCIKADFKCVLDNYAMRSGSYGVAIRVTSDTDEVIVFDLDSAKDMFGNPYAFTTWMSQQQAFKFTESIGNIKSIEGFFYQKGDFKYFNGTEPVDVPVIENGIVPNIWMQNLEVYFGTDVSQVEDNTVKIVTNNDLKYQGTSNIDKDIELIWYNKGEGNKYLGFSDGEFNKEQAQQIQVEDAKNYYWIQWQLDGQDGSLEDLEFTKKEDWEQTLTKVTIKCRPELSFTELQATVWLNGNKYKSNFITFTNQTDQANLVVNKDITISIVNNETSKDVYPLYGEDNKIINSAEASTIRSVRVEATWSKGILTDTFWQGAIITWTIPSQSTMLLPNFGKSAYEETRQITDINYTEIVDANGNKKKVLSEFVCPYHLNDVYHDLYDDNIITCTIKLPNQDGLLVATKRFEFSSQGTSGTDYTLVVRPKDDRPYGFGKVEIDEGIFVVKTTVSLDDFEAKLYDLKGEEVESEIELQFWNPKLGNTGEEQKTYNNYNVLRASTQINWAGRQVDLVTYYPIIYSKYDYSAQVPTKIFYDSFGSLPNLQSGMPLVINEISNENITWELVYSFGYDTDDSTQRKLSQMPRIEDNTLLLPSVFINTYEWAYLVAKESEDIIWTSPIIIQQYKYGSKVLNNWDGQTIIDNQNNRVLTNAFAAGNIDKNNAFNGVIMGQIAQITEGNIHDKKTGLFGYKSGDQVYGFRDDGTAFIGKSGAGRIYFDGTKGFIASEGVLNEFRTDYNWNSTNAGIILDLAKGKMKVQNSKGYLSFDDDNFQIKIPVASLQFENGGLGTYIQASTEGLQTQVSALNSSVYNFFTNAYEEYSSSNYHIGTYILGDGKFFDGRNSNNPKPFEYTITICVTPGRGVEKIFGCWMGGMGRVAEWDITSYETQILTKTHSFWQIYEPTLGSPDWPYIGFYHTGNSIGTTTIHWAKITRTPLPENYTMESQFKQTAQEISAKVSSEHDGSSASWRLTSDGFRVYQGQGTANEVLKVDNSGLHVTGDGTFTGVITATEGKIGSWLITDGYLTTINQNNKNPVHDHVSGLILNANVTDDESVIIYGRQKVGNSFIDNLLITAAGKVIARNLHITGGTITVGDNFEVKNDGTVICKSIDIKGGNDSKLAQWNIETNGMWSSQIETYIENNTNKQRYCFMHLITSGTTYNTYNIGSSGDKNDWRFLLGVGDTQYITDTKTTYNFGIDKRGYLYSNAFQTGENSNIIKILGSDVLHNNTNIDNIGPSIGFLWDSYWMKITPLGFEKTEAQDGRLIEFVSWDSFFNKF